MSKLVGQIHYNLLNFFTLEKDTTLGSDGNPINIYSTSGIFKLKYANDIAVNKIGIQAPPGALVNIINNNNNTANVYTIGRTGILELDDDNLEINDLYFNLAKTACRDSGATNFEYVNGIGLLSKVPKLTYSFEEKSISSQADFDKDIERLFKTVNASDNDYQYYLLNEITNTNSLKNMYDLLKNGNTGTIYKRKSSESTYTLVKANENYDYQYYYYYKAHTYHKKLNITGNGYKELADILTKEDLANALSKYAVYYSSTGSTKDVLKIILPSLYQAGYTYYVKNVDYELYKKIKMYSPNIFKKLSSSTTSDYIRITYGEEYNSNYTYHVACELITNYPESSTSYYAPLDETETYVTTTKYYVCSDSTIDSWLNNFNTYYTNCFNMGLISYKLGKNGVYIASDDIIDLNDVIIDYIYEA